jgi:hypothetical protein
MTKEHEYHAYAAACVKLANKATKEDDKKHLLAVAEAWLVLADRIKRPVGGVNDLWEHPELIAKLGHAI